MTTTRPIDNRLRIYTDAPANCRLLPDGHLDFDRPCNVLVHRTSTQLSLPLAECRQSVRAVFSGRRRFETSGGRHEVDPSSYLLLNAGQTVRSQLAAAGPVECLNVTFRPGFLEETLRALQSSDESLLDLPVDEKTGTVRFLERVYRHDQVVSPVLFRIRAALGRGQVATLWLDEQFHALAERMLRMHMAVTHEVNRMPAARLSTRIEMYERVQTARDFMEGNLSEPISIEEIARVACMSPHHFLRVFRKASRETPHQYLLRRRMERARKLLTTTDRPITEICSEVGFDSLSSFSWVFRQRCGLSPRQYRQANTPSLE